MKKGRPAHTVSALADTALSAQVAEVLARETGSLGVRGATIERWPSARQTDTVDVAGFPVRVKVSPGRVKVEHDDAARVAGRVGLPLREVISLAEEAGRRSLRIVPEPVPDLLAHEHRPPVRITTTTTWPEQVERRFLAMTRHDVAVPVPWRPARRAGSTARSTTVRHARHAARARARCGERTVEGIDPSVLATRPAPVGVVGARVPVPQRRGRRDPPTRARGAPRRRGPRPRRRSGVELGDPDTSAGMAASLDRLQDALLAEAALAAAVPADDPALEAHDLQPATQVDDAAWLLRHTVHDVSHHLTDVGRGLHLLGAGAPTQEGRVRAAQRVRRRRAQEADRGGRGRRPRAGRRPAGRPASTTAGRSRRCASGRARSSTRCAPRVTRSSPAPPARTSP